MNGRSNLERVLRAGHFAVTGECGPPQGADAEVVRKKAGYLKGYVDAVNVTDNQTSIVRMSSLAACLLIKEVGLEPLLQMVVRDRNRIALQSDLLGAAAHGINNVLCLSGDHQIFGNQQEAKNVYDIDSVNLIDTVRMMRDDGKILGGDEVEGAPGMYIGAAANPFGDPFDFRPIRLAKKVKAGVDFIQTQCIYNMPKFREYMKRVVDMGLHEKVHVMAGITPLKSLPMARYMATKVSGIDVPDDMIARLKGVEKKQRAKEGIKIAIEQMQEVKEIEGVHGVHLMAIEWEHKVPDIVKEAGFHPRPKVD